MRRNIIIATAALLLLRPACGQVVGSPEPDSKDIPKPILILGLYCNSAMGSIKSKFDDKPDALPWKANNQTRSKISAILEKLDFNGWGYAKAIKDKAIKESEAEFIKFTAIHETSDWMKNIQRNCQDPTLSGPDYEKCLQETNTEVYKCYKQIIDRISK